MSSKVKKFIFLLSLIFWLRLSLPAGFSVGFFAGPSSQKPGRQGLEFNADTRWAYGIRAGFKLLIIGIEAQYLQVAHHLQLKEITHAWQGRQVDFSFFGAAVKSYFSLLILHPYLSVGYGYYSAGIQDLDKDRKNGFNLAAGLEISLGKRLSLQAEGRYHRVVLDIQQADFKLGDFVLTAGLNFVL